MEIEYKITSIEPVYEFDSVTGGYFNIKYGYTDTDTFKLSFVPFLDSKIRDSDELFMYLKKTSADKTVSHAIFDLYDLGFPVDEWVDTYMEEAKNNLSADIFNKLIQFYNFMRDFNSPSGSLD